MSTKWRVIKTATGRNFDYVGVEFDEYGTAYAIRVNADETSVRKTKTPEFEAFEGGEWITISYGDVQDLLKETNEARRQYEQELLTEEDVRDLFYQADQLNDARTKLK